MQNLRGLQRAQLIEKVIDAGVVAVVRADSPEKAVKIVDALVAGGITAIELTYSVPHANDIIAHLVEQYKGTDVIIGAGTVLEAASARLALIAGAQFVVSPSFSDEVAKICNLYQIPYIPGVMTPREVVTAMEYGSELIKLFPGDTAGPRMIKDLKGPFPFINILPSGGVNADNVSEWVDAGAAAVSAGGSVTAPAAHDDYAGVSANATRFVAAYEEARRR
jgi:2-dehydro-3-deoxyphosphogluconate aldolase/(4S)-4-hydroxy-2-oxoglutarate aldolase